MIKPLLFLLLSVFTLPAWCIVNIENMRVDSADKTEGFDSKLSFEVSGSNGNTQKVKAGLGARAQWYSPTGTRFIVLNYEYGESSDIKDTDKKFFHLRNIGYLNGILAWEAFTQIESDEFTRLKLRALIGTGLRWETLHTETQSIYLGLGVFRSKEEIEQETGVTDSGVSYFNRANTYMVYKLAISDHSRLVNTLYYQPNIDDTSDYRLLEQFGLQMDITRNLSFKLSIDVSHDSMAPQLIKETDTTYNTGFEYNF